MGYGVHLDTILSLLVFLPFSQFAHVLYTLAMAHGRLTPQRRLS
jgi:hypothetical protein